jgi:hypothetical protein
VLFDHVPTGTAGCGDPYVADQRFQPRPQDDGCEPGAVEAPAPPEPEPGPLTNRTNFLGTGDLLPTPDRENYFLAINGPCSGREQGDLIIPVSTANFNYSSPSFRCSVGSGPVANTFHDPNGYVYAVEVPDTWPGGSLAIEAYDASICSSDFNAGGGANWTTTFNVLEGSLDPAEPLVNPVVSTRSFARTQNCGTGSGGCGSGTTSTWQSRWCVLHTIEAPAPGATYFVQVFAVAGNSLQHYINEFSLRANPSGGSFEACTSDASTATVGVPYSSECPVVHPSGWISGFRDLVTPTSVHPLAFIEPLHNDRTLELSLFDPGEGQRFARILDPFGNPVTFDWEVVNETGSDTAPGAQPSGGVWSGTADTFYLDGNASGCTGGGYPQPGPNRTSTSHYNDRLIIMRVELPADIASTYGGATRWLLQFETCNAPTDRTTWKVDVVD